MPLIMVWAALSLTCCRRSEECEKGSLLVRIPCGEAHFSGGIILARKGERELERPVTAACPGAEFVFKLEDQRYAPGDVYEITFVPNASGVAPSYSRIVAESLCSVVTLPSVDYASSPNGPNSAGVDADADAAPGAADSMTNDAQASSGCLEGQRNCGESCIDPGGCCDSDDCPKRANSRTSCSEGACKYECLPGYDRCSGAESGGCETNVQGSDTQNCGGCGKVCTGTCAQGSCSPIGERCSSNTDCSPLGSRGVCAQDGQSGFCSLGCSVNACPGGSVCTKFNVDWVCVPACKQTKDCRPGASCVAIPSSLEQYGEDIRLCRYYRIGLPCTDDLDCEGISPSASCWRETPSKAVLPNGYCVMPCTSTSMCPTGSLCLLFDGGHCIAQCTAAVEDACRPGYGCFPTGVPDLNFCWVE